MSTDGLESTARRICDQRHLEFVKPVGEGTFKQSFHVVDSTGTHLALKIYKAERASPRDAREISAMQKCSHRNIAKLLSVEAFSDGHQRIVAITEEFLPGGTLTSKGRLAPKDCLTIGIQLVDALAHIAALKLVHRDIKPDNIIFREDGLTPVLTDFGVVRDLMDSSLTPTWAPRGPGTPYFSAPEQLNNQKGLIDWRTDQFALGVALASTMFDEHPYQENGCTDEVLLHRVSSRQLPASWFAKQVANLGFSPLLKMIAPWPIDRYRRPKDLTAAWSELKG